MPDIWHSTPFIAVVLSMTFVTHVYYLVQIRLKNHLIAKLSRMLFASYDEKNRLSNQPQSNQETQHRN